MRRFELVEDNRREFCEVEVEGGSIVTRSGRLGTGGTTEARTFRDPSAADDSQEFLNQTLGWKGFVEVAVPVGRRLFTDALLERERRHSRELAEADSAAAEETEAALDEFEGSVELSDGRMVITFGGDRVAPNTVVALVRRIDEAMPRALQLICDFASPGPAFERSLAGVTLPSVRAFIFDTPFQTVTRQTENSAGDLATVLRACPLLERVFATGALRLSATRHDALEALHLSGNPVPRSVFEALGSCEFPSLERLAVMLSSDAGNGADDALVEAMVRLEAPRLKEVHLSSVNDVPALLAKLVQRGLTARWEVLSLEGTWRGAVETGELLPVLAVHGRELARLRVLAVPLPDAVASAKALVACVRELGEIKDMVLPRAYEAW